MSDNKVAILFLLGLSLPALSGIFVSLLSLEVRVKKSPELAVQAEIVGIRMESGNLRSDILGAGQRDYIYIVSFKVTDGSVKEIAVGKNRKKEPCNSVYNSLNEGDTGILTYKELENAETGFFVSYSYRLFISFEKDFSPEPDN